MEFSKEKNKTITRQIPFSEVVKVPKTGVYIVQAKEKNALLTSKAEATQWVIVSDLALTTFIQKDGGIWVNVRSLSTAESLASVDLQLLSYNNTILKSVKTDKNGVAFFEPLVTTGKGGNRPLMLLAYIDDKKSDFSFLTLDTPAFDLSDRGVSREKYIPVFRCFFIYRTRGLSTRESCACFRLIKR